MPVVSEVEALFHTLTHDDNGWDRHLYPKLVEHFRGRGDFEDGQELSVYGEVLPGITHALSSYRLGLFVDWSEAFLLRDKCWQMVESMVGLPDEYWHEPARYNEFVWAGDDVAVGLAAFDVWLAEENVEFRCSNPRRLVNVDTGSDFYLAILCYQDKVQSVIEELAALGLSANTARLLVE